ncbi:hypothetical protein, partial [Phytoactinopolyspora endophytica]|uniref:hypothetical protein n=1 Tax=Phytoactinopolyspora endophytica TaxID=1642495 RepID=UPI0013EB66E8
MRERSWRVALFGFLVIMLPSCTDDDTEQSEPTPTQSAVLPPLEDGRLVRVLGNGSGEPLRGVDY